MCPAIHRPKMLFGTETEALNFIKFNKSEVGNYLRSYYCEACCGWHITHTQKIEGKEYRDLSKINLGTKPLVDKIIAREERKKQKEKDEVEKLKKQEINLEKRIKEYEQKNEVKQETVNVIGHIDLPPKPTKQDKIEKRKLQVNIVKSLDANILFLSKNDRNTYFRENGLRFTSGVRGLISKIVESFNSSDSPEQFIETTNKLYETYIETGTCKIK